MAKTLLLCFIHGFKGDEETFFEFPKVSVLHASHSESSLTRNIQHLQRVVSEERWDLEVHTAVYPKYETRGDLAACVETFREWFVLSG